MVFGSYHDVECFKPVEGKGPSHRTLCGSDKLNERGPAECVLLSWDITFLCLMHSLLPF